MRALGVFYCGYHKLGEDKATAFGIWRVKTSNCIWTDDGDRANCATVPLSRRATQKMEETIVAEALVKNYHRTFIFGVKQWKKPKLILDKYQEALRGLER